MECKEARAPASRRSASLLRRRVGSHLPVHLQAPRYRRCHEMEQGPLLLSDPWTTPVAEAERFGHTLALRKSPPRRGQLPRPWTDPAFRDLPLTLPPEFPTWACSGHRIRLFYARRTINLPAAKVSTRCLDV